MHACGHDCHSAMLLGAFKAIAQGYVKPKTNIRFVWQRAEEFTGDRSGGEKLLQEGVCNGVDFSYGLHISSIEKAGTFSSRAGVYLANAAQIRFTVECSGGHVMRPDLGSNAIYLMTDILNSLRGFEGLFFPPDEPIAFVPSIARSGKTSNIRPNQAEICLAVRNFLPKDRRNQFVEAVKKKINSVVSSYPTAKVSTFNFYEGYPPLKNDFDHYHFINDLLKDSKFTTREAGLAFAGEDFAYYLEKTPGAFWILGARQEPLSDHHSSTFNPDESTLWQGVNFWLLLTTPIYSVLI